MERNPDLRRGAGGEHWYAIAFTVLFLLFASVALVWLQLDCSPPNWDDAWYLTNSLVIYDAWTAGGVAGLARQFLSALEFKAPLIAALPAPFYLVAGRNWHFGYLVNVAAMLLLFAAVLAIGKRCWSSRAGLIAVYITGSMPLLYGLARWYLVEYASAAIVATALWILMASDNLESGPATVLLGTLCGVGLLLKAGFPLYVLARLLLALWRCQRRLRAAALVAVPCLILALPWYAFHWRATLENAISAGYGDTGNLYGTGAVFSAGAIARYLAHVISDGVSTYYAALAVVLVALIVVQKRARALCALAPLGLWGLAFAIFLFGGNKDVRFIAPILPAFALAIASLLDSAAGHRRWVLAAALTIPLGNTLAVSFGWPYRAAGLRYTRAYERVDWRQEEALGAIRDRIQIRPGEKKLVIVGTDRPFFNVHNFELVAVQEHLPLRFETTAYQKDMDTIRGALDSASFVVLEEGGQRIRAFSIHTRPSYCNFCGASRASMRSRSRAPCRMAGSRAFFAASRRRRRLPAFRHFMPISAGWWN